MEQSQIILASTSPRRQQMLSWLTTDFTCVPANIDETPRAGENPVEYTKRMAVEKAMKSRKNICCEDAYIIGSDTTVFLKHQIIGKPASPEDAVNILQNLRGKDHLVCTAAALLHTRGKKYRIMRTFCETLVHLRDMSDQEIQAFVDSGEPMGKAGAYSIQNREFHPVESIQGCYASVMGFPLCHLQALFQSFTNPFECSIRQACTEGTGVPCSYEPTPLVHRTIPMLENI